MIYLDNAATTFPKPEEVYANVDYVQRNLAVNVGRGSYKIAAKAMALVDEARTLLAELVGIDNPHAIVFTPSATIAANEVIYGLGWDAMKNVYLSPFEHNAIARPVHKKCAEYGIVEQLIPFDCNSQAWDESETERLFATSPPDYVFLNHVSNVTGAILPIERIARLAKHYGATIIVDASQSLGLLQYRLKDAPIDFMIFAGHKNLYASWGIGGWISNTQMKLKPLLAGGTGSDSLNLDMADATPIGFEPGSPNIIAIASLRAAIKWLNSVGLEVIAEKKRKLVDKLVGGLFDSGAILYLPADREMHTSVVSFSVPGYIANEVGSILSLDYDIAVRTGYHCAPFVHDFLGTRDSQGTVRVSVSFFNSEEDINALLNAVKEL